MKTVFTALTCSLLTLLSVNSFAQQHSYTVQVAAYIDKSIATNEMKEFKSKGLLAFLTLSESAANGTDYQVNVGHLSTRANAINFRNKLVSKYQVAADAFVKIIDGSHSTILVEAPIIKPVFATSPLAVFDPNPPPKPAAAPKLTAQETGEKESEFDLKKCPAPTPVICPEQVSPQASALIPVVKPPESAKSVLSIGIAAMADASNYTLNFPAGNGGLGLANTWSSTPLVGAGFAILPAFDFLKSFQIQSGVMIFQKTFNVTYNNGVFTQPASESYTAIEVPLVLFYKIFEHLEAGIGGYYLVNPANTIVQNTFGGAPLPDSTSTGNDSGLTAAIDWILPLSPQTDLLFSGRYNYGKGNMASVGTDTVQAFTDFQLLIGLHFSFTKEL